MSSFTGNTKAEEKAKKEADKLLKKGIKSKKKRRQIIKRNC
jgi:hypothetical protein